MSQIWEESPSPDRFTSQPLEKARSGTCIGAFGFRLDDTFGLGLAAKNWPLGQLSSCFFFWRKSVHSAVEFGTFDLNDKWTSHWEGGTNVLVDSRIIPDYLPDTTINHFDQHLKQKTISILFLTGAFDWLSPPPFCLSTCLRLRLRIFFCSLEKNRLGFLSVLLASAVSASVRFRFSAEKEGIAVCSLVWPFRTQNKNPH